jgi:hypothetical protein
VREAAPAPSATLAAAVEVHVEDFPAEEAFVVRGSTSTGQAVLFGGQCAQPQGYADAIKLAAARRGQLVALRGDKACTGDFRGWSRYFPLPGAAHGHMGDDQSAGYLPHLPFGFSTNGAMQVQVLSALQ